MRKRIVIAVVSALLLVMLLLCIVPSIAKYTASKGQQSEIYSENFYFTSDYLKENETPVYEIFGNSVTFKVRNYIDSLRINQSDISYTVSADGGAVDILNGSLAGAVPSSKDITLTYAFAEDELQKEITVSVTGTGDYTQTLKAKFILIKPGSLTYQIKDQANRDYAELYIYTGNTAPNVTINWDKTKLLIDETNDYVFGKLNSDKNSVTVIDIPADTTVKIVFFKNDITQDYTYSITKLDGNININ